MESIKFLILVLLVVVTCDMVLSVPVNTPSPTALDSTKTVSPKPTDDLETSETFIGLGFGGFYGGWGGGWGGYPYGGWGGWGYPYGGYGFYG